MNVAHIVVSIHAAAVGAIAKKPEIGGIASSTAGSRGAPLATVMAGEAISRTKIIPISLNTGTRAIDQSAER